MDGDIQFEGAYIITPIHINDDTLKIGSEGLNNLTIDPVVEEDEQVVLANLGEAKAWGRFNNGSAANAGIDGSYNVSAYLRISSEKRISRISLINPLKSNSTMWHLLLGQ